MCIIPKPVLHWSQNTNFPSVYVTFNCQEDLLIVGCTVRKNSSMMLRPFADLLATLHSFRMYVCICIYGYIWNVFRMYDSSPYRSGVITHTPLFFIVCAYFSHPISVILFADIISHFIVCIYSQIWSMLYWSLIWFLLIGSMCSFYPDECRQILIRVLHPIE